MNMNIGFQIPKKNDSEWWEWGSLTIKSKLTNLAASNLLRQHTDVANGSGFREAIERGVRGERRNEVDVDGGVS